MLIKKTKSLRNGFSLVEVLVFVTVVAIFFTSAASIASYLIRTAKVNERKLIASRYAEELMEWLRSEKEVDWNAFAQMAYPNNTTSRCFGVLSWTSGTCNIDPVISRRAYLQRVMNAGFIYQVNINVEVYWTEGGKNYTVPLKTTFSVWETGMSPTPTPI